MRAVHSISTRKSGGSDAFCCITGGAVQCSHAGAVTGRHAGRPRPLHKKGRRHLQRGEYLRSVSASAAAVSVHRAVEDDAGGAGGQGGRGAGAPALAADDSGDLLGRAGRHS